MNGTHLDLLPVISLTAPANLTTNTTDNTPEFIFNVSDDLFTQSFLNCSLWMGNASTTAAYGTNNTVFNRTKTVITANSTLNNATLMNGGLTVVMELTQSIIRWTEPINLKFATSLSALRPRSYSSHSQFKLSG